MSYNDIKTYQRDNHVGLFLVFDPLTNFRPYLRVFKRIGGTKKCTQTKIINKCGSMQFASVWPILCRHQALFFVTVSVCLV